MKESGGRRLLWVIRFLMLVIVMGLLLLPLATCLSDPFESLSASDNGDGTFGSSPAYTAGADVLDCHVTVVLDRIHPFLAEYRKRVEVQRDGRSLGQAEFIDTGGFAALHCYLHGGELVIAHGTGRALWVDLEKETSSVQDAGGLLGKPPEARLGKFCFVEAIDESYAFVQEPDHDAE